MGEDEALEANMLNKSAAVRIPADDERRPMTRHNRLHGGRFFAKKVCGYWDVRVSRLQSSR